MSDQRTTTPVVNEAALLQLQTRLRGRLLRPADQGYDAARRVWNAMIDKRPAAIARCVGAADVIQCVAFAREQNLLVSMRGGGHNVAGSAVCDGGLMIDLSPMKSIRVDLPAKTVRSEPGVLWGELDRETQAFGLATPGGFVSTTGIAGLTLGGGQSWLASKFGFAIDNLLSVDIVTAKGELMRASLAENDDLFWAVRCAGHNFGVVTSFEYRLHPVTTVLGGMVLHPFDRAAEVLRFYRDFSAALPDELTTAAGILTGPDGTLLAAVIVCFAGALDEGERVIAPVRRFGPPVADTIGPTPYTAHQTMLDAAFPPGRFNYWKSSLTNRLSDDVIEAIVSYGRRIPSSSSAIVIADFHGAYSRVGKHQTAYFHRDMQYDIVIASSWNDQVESERNHSWTRELFHAIEHHVPHAVYVNDLDQDEGDERVKQAYGENYTRLAAIKHKYDPTNVFRANKNIRPAATQSAGA